MDVKELAEILNKYPELKNRLKEMIDIVESPSRGELSTVDAIEERTVGVVRSLGQNLLQNWAEQQSLHTSLQIKKRMPSAKKNTKKNPVANHIREN